MPPSTPASLDRLGNEGRELRTAPRTRRLPSRAVRSGILVLLAIPSTPATSPAAPQDLIAEIQSLLASDRARGLRFAMEFVPLESGERRPSVSVAGDLPLIPASVTKLVTAAAALETFSSMHTFQTRVHLGGPLEDGVVQGDLGFVGEGDPYLTSERVWLLAHQIRTAGLRRVEGDLVIHASGFPLEDPTAAASLGGTDRSYAARPSAVAANFNSLTLRVSPGRSPGADALVSGDPYDLDYLAIDATGLRTGPPGGPVDWSVTLEPGAQALRYRDWIARVETAGAESADILPSFVLTSVPLETARIRGVLPVGLAPQTVYRRARYPLPMTGYLLRAGLEQFGVEVSGSIRIDTRSPSTQAWLEFPSIPVAELIERMNRYSSNFIANQLALAVHQKRSSENRVASGTGTSHSPGTESEAAGGAASSAGPLALSNAPGLQSPLHLADAGRSLIGWLAEVLPEASRGCSLFDGSGLSIDNRLTAAALTGLLVRSWDDLRIQPKLIASLPGPGEPGTLRSRFRDGYRPVLWAKTGTLSDSRVSSLSGYFEDSNGEAVAFAILLNADPGSAWDVRAMQALQERWIGTYRN